MTLESFHFAGSESIYLNCIQFNEESFTWKWFSSQDIIYLFMGLILHWQSIEREFVAACQKGETHKMHFKGMNVMKNELNCKRFFFFSGRDIEIAHVRQRIRKEFENWMPLKCLMSSKISGASMHFCLWFTPFFVCSLACVWKYLRCFLFSLAVYLHVLPLLLVESRCAYFHCDSIQSSRFAWFHPTFRNFLDGNRIPLWRDDEISQDALISSNSKC